MEPDNGIKLEELRGAFVESLKRNNKRIREDRAIAISEDDEFGTKTSKELYQLYLKSIHSDQKQ